MGRRAEGAAKVYIKGERGSRRCEIHSKQIPSEEQRPHGLPPTAFFFLFKKKLTSFNTDCLGSLTDKGGLERKQSSEYLFSFPPFSLDLFFFLFPGSAGLLSAHHYVEQYGFECERFLLPPV